MTLAEFANLTQSQLYDLYGHPGRDRGVADGDGVNLAEMTDEEADRVALAMAQAYGKPEDVERVRETIRQREEAKQRGRPADA